MRLQVICGVLLGVLGGLCPTAMAQEAVDTPRLLTLDATSIPWQPLDYGVWSPTQPAAEPDAGQILLQPHKEPWVWKPLTEATPEFRIQIQTEAARPNWATTYNNIVTNDGVGLQLVEGIDWTQPSVAPTIEVPWFKGADLEQIINPDVAFDYGDLLGDVAPILAQDDLELILSGQGTRSDFEALASDLVPMIEANPRWGAVYATQLLESSPDLIRDLAAPEWASAIDGLALAHRLGNPEATAILGESYLLGRGVTMDQDQGLGLLKAAADLGQPRAMTLLGAYGYDRPAIMTREQAVAISQRSLAAGDANAAGILAQDAYARQNVDDAVDYSLIVIGSGTEAYAGEARVRLANTCDVPSAVCKPLKVAVVTSREPGNAASGEPWGDRPSSGYDANFAFVETMVPFDEDALVGEPPPPSGLEAIGDWFQADQFGQSTFFLRDNSLIASETFFDNLAAAREQGEENRILVYVHGFNNSVEDALLAVARMKQRGQLPGIPLVYSWAAGNGLIRPAFDSIPFYSGYSRDVQMASNSCFAFTGFLTDLTDRFGAENIILVAHSHGAKLLHAALTGCEFRTGAPDYAGGMFDSVVYAAPDIDLDQFDQSFAALGSMAKRVAIYVSSKDGAIYASSQYVRGGLPRVGGASKTGFGSKIEVIDATDITDPNKDSGHSYAFINYLALSDMRRFLNGETAVQRCLVPLPDGRPGWSLNPVC